MSVILHYYDRKTKLQDVEAVTELGIRSIFIFQCFFTSRQSEAKLLQHDISVYYGLVQYNNIFVELFHRYYNFEFNN